MRKDFNIFSKDELAMLKNFANKVIIEDKKIYGIQGNNNIIINIISKYSIYKYKFINYIYYN